MLDVLGVVRPGWDTDGLARLLAEQVRSCLQAYEVQHPKRAFTLCPGDTSWFQFAPALRNALGLQNPEGEPASGDE